jgi:hypothetical protein
MASPFSNTAEGGTNTTAVTTGNSGGASGTAWDAVTLSGTTTCTFSSTFLMDGAMAYRFAYAASQAGYLVKNFSPTATTTRVAWRFYIYIPAGEVFTSQDLFFVRSASAAVMSLGTNGSGQMIVRNSAGTTVATATSAFSTGVIYRIEVAEAVGTTTGNGTIAVSYYLGHSTTAVQAVISSTAQNCATAAATLVRFGDAALVASARIIHYDGLAGAETPSGFLGPSGAILAGVVATGSGAAVAPVVTGAATVTAVVATGSGLLIPPTVTAASGATVVSPVLTGSGLAPAPIVTGGATLVAVVASGSGTAAAPTVTGGASVTAVKGTGTGAAVSPTVAAGASVTAVKATSNSLFPAPTVTAGATVTAVAATASGVMPSPTITAGTAVAAVTATGTGSMVPPTVSGVQSPTIAVPAMSSSGMLLAPTVVGGAAVAAVPGLGSGMFLAPTVAVQAVGTITAVTMTAVGMFLAPTVNGVRVWPTRRTLAGAVVSDILAGDTAVRTLTAEPRDPLTLSGEHHRTLTSRTVPSTLEGGTP